VGPRAVLEAVMKRKIPSLRRESNPGTPNPLDFNAPVPAFHKFFNSVRKKFFGCVFNQFALRQFLELIVTADET
jgi:hypothetical protein